MAKGAIRVDWYPVNALAGMKFLTPMEELAYRRIIDLLYTEGGALPDDDETMAEQTRTFKDWKKVKAGLIRKEKISLSDGQITNEKCTEVLTDIQQRSDAARASGKASGEKRRKLLPTKKERPLSDRSNNVDENAPKTPTESELSHLVTQSVIDGGGSARDELGWPLSKGEWVDILTAETLCGDVGRDLWLRRTSQVLVGWHQTDKFHWDDVVAGVKAGMVGKANDPPSSWKYFSQPIARAKRDRETPTPEAKSNERRNPNYKTTAQRGEDSTISAFGRVFADLAAGEADADGTAQSDEQGEPLRIASAG